MSSHHSLNPSSGDIDHVEFLSEDIAALYLSDNYSDVTLIVGGKRFNAHKNILAARSQYFRALLFGGLKETTQREVELKGISLVAFKNLLKYIYTGRMSLAEQTVEVILDILGLARVYGFSQLENSMSNYLRRILSISNVCLIFDAALLYNLGFLIWECEWYMDKHAPEVLQHESFLQLSVTALNTLLPRNSFYAPEIDIFLAVGDWIKANPDIAPETVLSNVRLPLISTTDLLNTVRLTGLVSSESILDAIATKTISNDSDLNYRGLLLVDKNVAKNGAVVLQGQMPHCLLNGDVNNYDMERGYTSHTICDSPEECIMIKLDTQYIINHIKMLLWDRDMRSYSYYIEVSVDKREWVRVIDHTEYFCRSWQYLYFKSQVVLYIRIVGTNNTVNKVFHVVNFEAYYTKHTENLSKGFIVPARNVATVERSASVIEGVCRSRNALLNGDTSNYDWDSGYTCHQLGSGSILVQLAQPYIIDSMRLLLWDCDDRSYSYYIEVSGNSQNWTLVADRTNEACRSWQTIHFQPPQPIVFIRIVGTHNTANEVFHCVHFECPAQIDEKMPALSAVLNEKLSTADDVQAETPSASLPALSQTGPCSTPSEIVSESVNIKPESVDITDDNNAEAEAVVATDQVKPEV